MALSPSEMASLFDILAEEETKLHSFETLCNKFHHVFKKQDKLKVANMLLFILQFPDILPAPPQRLVAVVLLHDLYRRDTLTTTPFLPVFVYIITQDDKKSLPDNDNKNGAVRTNDMTASTSDDTPDKSNINYINEQLPKFTTQEQNFLSQLIVTKSKELLKSTAPQVINSDIKKYSRADISKLEKEMESRNVIFQDLVKGGVPIVISDPEPVNLQSQSNNQKDLKKLFEDLCLDESFIPNMSFVPEMVRLAPPLLRLDDELLWEDFNDPWAHKVFYEGSDTNMNLNREEATALLEKATQCTLNTGPTKTLSAYLRQEDSPLAHELGITPQKFPDLCEHNPMIAVAVLLKMMQSSFVTDYFNALVNMELTLHSMEVFNRLTARVDLPQEFVHLYVSNCITTCEAIKDRYMQNRLVRLVSIFLQSLIHNRVISRQDLHSELQSFCISFIHVREAAALFQLLKLDDNGQEMVTQNPSSSTMPSTSSQPSTSSSTNESKKKETKK